MVVVIKIMIIIIIIIIIIINYEFFNNYFVINCYLFYRYFPSLTTTGDCCYAVGANQHKNKRSRRTTAIPGKGKNIFSRIREYNS